MPVTVIYCLEMIDVHHQNAKSAVFGACPGGFAAEFGEKGATRKQARKVVVRNEAVNLELVFAVDLVEQVETQDLLADRYLVAVLQRLFGDTLAVDECAAAGTKIGQYVIVLSRLLIEDLIDPGMAAGNCGIVDADVGFKGTAEDDFLAFEWDRHGDEFPAQKNERGSEFAGLPFGFGHSVQAGCEVRLRRSTG